MTKSKKPQKQRSPLAQAYQMIREKLAYLNTIPDTEAPSTLYHYTSLAGLKGILSDGKMYATRNNYLNDPMDTTLGLTQCIKVLDHFVREKNTSYIEFDRGALNTLRDKQPRIAYVASFSSEGDGLLQWQVYGDRGRGVSIGFAFDELNVAVGVDAANADENDEDDSDWVPDYVPVRINYGKKFQIGRLKEFWASARAAHDIAKNARQSTQDRLQLYCVRALLGLASSHKQEEYMGENEWRFVTYVGGDFPNHTKFREQGDLLIPYLKMPLCDKMQKELPPIERIVYGTANSDPDIKGTIELLLESEGYKRHRENFPEVLTSNTKIRAY